MVDYAVDSTFDLFKTDHNDIAEVDGIEEFEQKISIRLHYKIKEYVEGYKDTDALLERVNLIVTRVAREEDVLDSIVSINASEVPEKKETLAVEIVYESADNYEELL